MCSSMIHTSQTTIFHHTWRAYANCSNVHEGTTISIDRAKASFVGRTVSCLGSSLETVDGGRILITPLSCAIGPITNLVEMSFPS